MYQSGVEALPLPSRALGLDTLIYCTATYPAISSYLNRTIVIHRLRWRAFNVSVGGTGYCYIVFTGNDLRVLWEVTSPTPYYSEVTTSPLPSDAIRSIKVSER